MNRSGLIIVGVSIALVGYALVCSGLSTLNPDLWGVSFSTLDGLIPGKLPGSGGAVADAAGKSGLPSPTVGAGGGQKRGVK